MKGTKNAKKRKGLQVYVGIALFAWLGWLW
jgi:hypothetical protein